MNSVNWMEGCRAVFCRKYNVKCQFCMGRFLCFFYDKIISRNVFQLLKKLKKWYKIKR